MLRLHDELYRKSGKLSFPYRPILYKSDAPLLYNTVGYKKVITKYRKDIKYIPVESVIKSPEIYNEMRFSRKTDAKILYRFYPSAYVTGRSVSEMFINDALFYISEEVSKTLKEPEDLEIIFESIKKRVTYEIELNTTTEIHNEYKSNSFNRTFSNFAYDFFTRVGDIVTGMYSVQRIIPTTEPINDAFGVGFILNQNLQFYKGIPLLYFAIDKNYIAEYRMRIITNKLEDIDTTRFKLMVDPMVIAKKTPYLVVKKFLNTILIPTVEKLNMEVIYVNMEKEIVDNGEFGYGIERFKEPLSKYKESIVEFLNKYHTPEALVYFDIN